VSVPAIGETITTERARELCAQMGLPHLVERIDADPALYKPWVFDGVSALDDDCAAFLSAVPDITAIALAHDLQYAYGLPGDEEERRRADGRFRGDLLMAGARPWVAGAMYAAVRAGGAGGILKTSFTWGFARLQA